MRARPFFEQATLCMRAQTLGVSTMACTLDEPCFMQAEARARAIFPAPQPPLSPHLSFPFPPPGGWVWVGGWVYVLPACVLDTGWAGAKGLLRLA